MAAHFELFCPDCDRDAVKTLAKLQGECDETDT